MTRDRRWKQASRDRMRKTGESYAAARHQLLQGASMPSPNEGDRQPAMYPFERFTTAAKRVLVVAQSVAEEEDLGFVGTDHLLLAVLDDPDSQAVTMLAALGTGAEQVEEALAAIPAGRRPPDLPEGRQPIPTGLTRRALARAVAVADQLGHPDVDTEHFLVALTVEADGRAGQALARAGVTGDAVMEAVVRLHAPPER
jgi:ATP-dependent Clp protease ATP-binding subunit ClpC